MRSRHRHARGAGGELLPCRPRRATYDELVGAADGRLLGRVRWADGAASLVEMVGQSGAGPDDLVLFMGRTLLKDLDYKAVFSGETGQTGFQSFLGMVP